MGRKFYLQKCRNYLKTCLQNFFYNCIPLIFKLRRNTNFKNESIKPFSNYTHS